MGNDTTAHQRDLTQTHIGIDESSELLAPAVNADLCFLCDKPVPKAKQLAEQVFPTWMMDEYDLRKQTMELPDRTSLPYEELKVTTCDSCHKKLETLELEVKEAVITGPSAVRALDPERLFLWLAKFYHGLFFRDMQQLLKPMNRMSPVMSNQDTIRGYVQNYVLLKKLLGRTTWSDFPASIFIFEALTGDEAKHNFDYVDSPMQPFLAIRCGRSYIVAALQDFGTLANYDGLEQWPQISTADSLKLHPMQCLEVTAVFRTLLMGHKPPRLMIEADDDNYMVKVLAPGSIDGLPDVHPWEVPLYERTLRAMFKHVYNTEIVGSHTDAGHMPTLLRDSSGNPLQASRVDEDILLYESKGNNG